MAYNDTPAITGPGWTLLTSTNITAITFQNQTAGDIWIKATVGATPPSTRAGALRYRNGEGERNVLLSDLFPGISGANRVYVSCDNPAKVLVSHA